MRTGAEPNLREDCSIRNVALGVAACIADYGMAFVEDDKVDALGTTLLAFFRTAGIAVHDPKSASLTPTVSG
ncbi:hypothetical protein L3i22_082790 [Actinoplanes sp. L3-i22]|nr:hypothetical protein L3i22_082790 [Actinoplanes sp. L3-i22]